MEPFSFLQGLQSLLSVIVVLMFPFKAVLGNLIYIEIITMCGLQYLFPAKSLLILAWYLANMCHYDFEKRRMLRFILKLLKIPLHLTDNVSNAITDAILTTFVGICLDSKTTHEETYLAFADGVIQIAERFPSLVASTLLSKLTILQLGELTEVQRRKIAGLHTNHNVANALASATSTSMSNFKHISGICATDRKTFVCMVCSVVPKLSYKAFDVTDWNHLREAIETFTRVNFTTDTTPLSTDVSTWSHVNDSSTGFEHFVLTAIESIFSMLLKHTKIIDQLESLMMIQTFLMTCRADMVCPPLVNASDNFTFCCAVRMVEALEKKMPPSQVALRFITILRHNSRDL